MSLGIKGVEQLEIRRVTEAMNFMMFGVGLNSENLIIFVERFSKLMQHDHVTKVKSSIRLLCKCQRKDRLHTNHSCHRRKYDLQRRYLN